MAGVSGIWGVPLVTVYSCHSRHPPVRWLADICWKVCITLTTYSVSLSGSPHHRPWERGQGWWFFWGISQLQLVILRLDWCITSQQLRHHKLQSFMLTSWMLYMECMDQSTIQQQDDYDDNCLCLFWVVTATNSSACDTPIYSITIILSLAGAITCPVGWQIVHPGERRE